MTRRTPQQNDDLRDEIHRRVAADPERLLNRVFPELPLRRGNDDWRVGKKGSWHGWLKNDRFFWHSHEDDKGGDCFALWMWVFGGDYAEAKRSLADLYGVSRSSSGFAPPSPLHRSAAPKRSAFLHNSERKPLKPILTMPTRAMDWWLEGQSYLRDRPGLDAEMHLAQLAEWREWPVGYVRTLVRAGLLGAPMFYKRRSRCAFPVYTPVPWPVGDNEPARDGRKDRRQLIGFRGRLFPEPDQARPVFSYPHLTKKIDPDATGFHPGLDPLPLVLTGAGCVGGIWQARCLICCEGEPDALTIPLAAGWWDEELGILTIPPGVAVVGIAGAGAGTDAFLNAYEPFWPSTSVALVFRDGDRAGDKWTEPGGFIERLRDRCSRVESRYCLKHDNGKKRDVNDLWREGRLSRAVLDAFLRSAGLTLTALEAAPLNHSSPSPPI